MPRFSFRFFLFVLDLVQLFLAKHTIAVDIIHLQGLLSLVIICFFRVVHNDFLPFFDIIDGINYHCISDVEPHAVSLAAVVYHADLFMDCIRMLWHLFPGWKRLKVIMRFVSIGLDYLIHLLFIIYHQIFSKSLAFKLYLLCSGKKTAFCLKFVWNLVEKPHVRLELENGRFNEACGDYW